MGAMLKIACSCVVGVAVATRLARQHSSDRLQPGKQRDLLHNMRAADKVVRADLEDEYGAELEEEAYLQHHLAVLRQQDEVNARAPETQRARWAEGVRREMAVVARVMRGVKNVSETPFLKVQNLNTLEDQLSTFARGVDMDDIISMDATFLGLADAFRSPHVREFQDLLEEFAAQKGLDHFQLPRAAGQSLYRNVVYALVASSESSYSAREFLAEFFLYASLKQNYFRGYVYRMVPQIVSSGEMPALNSL